MKKTLVGLTGSILGLFTNAPQLWKVYREPDVSKLRAVSVHTYIIALCTSLVWFVYFMMDDPDHVQAVFCIVVALMSLAIVSILYVKTKSIR